jgi:hypothetical protein
VESRPKIIIIIIRCDHKRGIVWSGEPVVGAAKGEGDG